MVTSNTYSTRTVNVAAEVPSFLIALQDNEYQINNITEFKKRLNRVYHTRASLGEIIAVENKLNSILNNDRFKSLMNDMTIFRTKSHFNEKYLANTDIHSFLKTDMMLWDLINEVTAISSKIEQEKIVSATYTNRSIQMLGGDLLFKKCDLIPENIKQVF